MQHFTLVKCLFNQLQSMDYVALHQYAILSVQNCFSLSEFIGITLIGETVKSLIVQRVCYLGVAGRISGAKGLK